MEQTDLVDALGCDVVPQQRSECRRACRLICGHLVDVVGCEVVHDGADDAG